MISVILATKNGEKYINRAIDSVFSQTERDLELIVVSDGSTDNTTSLVKDRVAQNNQIRLIELTQNIGPGLARDKGIREAKGEYIALVDDDDYWISKEKLILQKDFLDQNKEHVLVGVANTHIVSEHNTPIKHFHLPSADVSIRKQMLLRNPFTTSSVLFKKDVYLKSGGFKNMYLSEDYDLWARMGLVGKMANIENADVAYTLHQSSASKKRTLELYKANLKIVLEHKNDYPNKILGILKCYGRIVLFHLKNIT